MFFLIISFHHALCVGSEFGLALLCHIECSQIFAALLEVVVYFLLRQFVDAYLVVESGDSGNLLLAVELCSLI